MVVEDFEWPPSTSVFESFNFTANDVRDICALWLKKVESRAIVFNGSHRMRPSSYAIWIIGLACVTLISSCAALGILFVKRLSKTNYNKFITVFVAVGVGSLITSSTLHLIPQGLGLADNGNHDYIMIMMFCIFGIYTFFFCDKFLKVTLESKKMNDIEMINVSIARPNDDLGRSSVRSTDSLIINGNVKQAFIESEQSKKRECRKKSVSSADGSQLVSYDMSRQAHGICVHDHEITFNDKKDSAIKTVAWMIVFGDGLHNLIDGISIGAAFSESLKSGLSVSLAVLAEEFPHELGDVAILLNAGMSLKQTLFYNLFSTLTCFIGFIVGVALGSVESFLRYIFGFSGGMFLYIALSCMMPEMKKTMEEALADGYRSALFILSLQTFGLALGTFSMFFFARYGDFVKIF